MACSSCEIPQGQSNQADSQLVCYCFNHTREDIRADFQASGVSTIEQSIRTAIDAGHCSCEVMNPNGRCCLGDVRSAYKDLGTPIG
jgi:hypothetical protein